MRDWKPGDVAIVDGPGKRLPITFFESRDTGELMFNNGAGHQHPVRILASTARPLVVLDLGDDAAEFVRILRGVGLRGEPSKPGEAGDFSHIINGSLNAKRLSAIADQIEQQTKPPKPEVFSHLAARQDNTHRALCGKVWEPSEDVTVVGKCPECADLAESGWIA
ncbi:MAG TPA: hypothetical protein VFH56_11175 [Acidimicrobiales bacterium]|nr:hypothetical protein [Acidimicrobiales bacterium]